MMLLPSLSSSRTENQQDYFLLGACIANTLLLLTFIWRVATHNYKPISDLSDLVPNIGSWFSPEIDIPLYVISWIVILISFVAYYFLNNYLSRRLDAEIKRLISKGLLFLSLTTLLGVHALYLVKALSGTGYSMEIDINILAFVYLATAISILILCLFARFRQYRILKRCIRWAVIFSIVIAGLFLLRSIYLNLLIVFPYQHVREYLLAESQLRTTDYSPAEILVTVLFILVFAGLLIISKSKLSFKNRLLTLPAYVYVVLVFIFTVLIIFYVMPNHSDYFLGPIILLFTGLFLLAKSKLSFKNRLLTLLVDVSEVLVIIFTVFDIRSSMFDDSNYYIGPINDILHGKTLLVDATSQYGLLSMYSVAILFKGSGIPLTYGNFALLNTIMYIAGYTLTYVILRLWLKDILVSIFGIFLIVQQNYFVQAYNPMLSPQVGFLRFGWWLLILVLVMITTKLDTVQRNYQRYMLRCLELLLIAVAFFWIADAGSFVLGSYIVFTFVSVFNNESGIRLKIKTFLFRIAEIISALLLVFAAISIFTVMRSHHWPDWYGYVKDSLIYSMGGFGMVPMPETGLYLLFVTVYLLSVSYIVVKLFFSNGKTENDMPIIAFITAFGILQFIYYAGRSHPNNLHNVVIPLIMVICWFVLKGLNFALSENGRDLLRRHVPLVSSLSLLIILLIALPLLLSTKQMILQVSNRGDFIELLNSRDDINRVLPDKNEQSDLKNSIIAIEENEKGQGKVALISIYDTYFLVETGKTNIMNSNNIKQFLFKFQYEKLASQLLEAKPSNIYIDHSPSGAWAGSIQFFKDRILSYYYFAENVGYLDRYVSR